jgi:hypothetical protein
VACLDGAGAWGLAVGVRVGEEVAVIHVLAVLPRGQAQGPRDGERLGGRARDAGGERFVQPRDLGRGVHARAVDEFDNQLLLGVSPAQSSP